MSDRIALAHATRHKQREHHKHKHNTRHYGTEAGHTRLACAHHNNTVSYYVGDVISKWSGCGLARSSRALLPNRRRSLPPESACTTQHNETQRRPHRPPPSRIASQPCRRASLPPRLETLTPWRGSQPSRRESFNSGGESLPSRNASQPNWRESFPWRRASLPSGWE